MTSVFMLSHGEYSDYQVDGIYSTMELAEAARIVCVRPEEYYINEMELDYPTPEYTEYSFWRSIRSDWIYDGYFHLSKQFPEFFVQGDKVGATVRARNYDQALKVFNEKFMKFKAGGWVVPALRDYSTEVEVYTTYNRELRCLVRVSEEEYAQAKAD